MQILEECLRNFVVCQEFRVFSFLYHNFRPDIVLWLHFLTFFFCIFSVLWIWFNVWIFYQILIAKQISPIIYLFSPSFQMYVSRIAKRSKNTFCNICRWTRIRCIFPLTNSSPSMVNSSKGWKWREITFSPLCSACCVPLPFEMHLSVPSLPQWGPIAASV